MRSAIFSGMVLIGSLFLADVITTDAALRAGGYELNACMVPFVASPFIHLLVKWSVMVFIVIAAQWTDLKASGSGTLIMATVIGWYAVVVFHNLSLLTAIEIVR
ncbi:MAG: hypothetical protein A4E35_01068 [Methanoregula sp. PtaU1.Bin051]|nr:MAG: hypothetical protein A4E35_01068 [Methanoregula sp. PtaU1.Bin051]